MENENKTEGELRDKKNARRQIIFLVLMLIAIICLIWAIITIYKYKEMLENPIGYSMDKFDLQTCSCLNNNFERVEIKSISYQEESQESGAG